MAAELKVIPSAKTERNDEIVETLEDFVARMKSRQILNINIVAATAQGDIETFSSFEDRILMLGALEYAKGGVSRLD